MRYLSIIVIAFILMTCSPVCAQMAGRRHAGNKFLSVKDPSEYSASFLSTFEKGPPHVRIQDSLFILNGDTDYFPTGLVRGRQYQFTGYCGGETYELNVTRTNYTDLKYRFTVASKSRVRYERQGIAILSSDFWIASEPIEDENGDESGGCGYWDKDKNCEYELTINDALNEKGHLLACVQQTCSKKKNETPLCIVTLRTN